MLTITPPMNPRSTALEESMLTITPPMNPRSTALEESMLTITPPMWFNLHEVCEQIIYKYIRYLVFITFIYNEFNCFTNHRFCLFLYLQEIFKLCFSFVKLQMFYDTHPFKIVCSPISSLFCENDNETSSVYGHYRNTMFLLNITTLFTSLRK